jgi:hypothetical protein
MNERIRELYENAHKEVVETNYDNGMSYIVLELDPDKFAELIVRECAIIVYQTCRDGDAGAQAILYEFDIDNARSQK